MIIVILLKNEFRDEVYHNNESITLCTTDTHHQNSIVECYIGKIATRG